MVLKAAELRYPRLYHTYVPAEADEINEKKLALTLGIKAAKKRHTPLYGIILQAMLQTMD